ncbi:MAG: glycosyltransferase family 2 protein [Bdellovibrionales bacterium]|nr:glycosyltransferase family 2 protein [Bdellovibrionales bacterium]
MKISLVLLTRNERECLEIIFPTIPRPGSESGFDEIVAVDGGSTDGTLEFFKKNAVPVIAQSQRGRGEAFQHAFKNLNSDAFIFFSPDGNENVSDIKKFKPLLQQGADIVIASRMMKESRNEEDDQLFKWRKWANNVFNLLANIFFRKRGPFITDSINGFRAITKDAAKKLQLDAPDYTIEYQMTMRALRHELNVVEFPTIEGNRVAGDTGAPAIPTGLRFIRRFCKEFFNS